MMTGYAKSKGVPVPHLAVTVSGLLLLLGGLSILFRFHMHLGIILVVICLLGMTFMMHKFWNEKDGAARMSDKVGFMKNIALIGALLMLFVR